MAPDVERHLRKLLNQGWEYENALRIAEGTAFRTPAFFGEMIAPTTDDGFKNDRMRKVYKKNAAKAGISTVGKRYMPELANTPGGLDAEAWVPVTEQRSHITNVLKKRGWSSEGRIEVKGSQGRDAPLRENYEPAPDIVERETNKELQLMGARTPTKKLKEKVRQETKQRIKGAM
jgi:hypothetical protein